MAEGHQASIREHKPSLHLHSQHGYRHFQPNHLHLVDSDGNTVEWQSRRARKGRYSSKRHHLATGDSSSAVSIRLRSLEDELKPHLTLDVSFWVAVFFTLGSVVWVVNGTLDADPLIPGFLVWLPLVYAEMQRPAVSKTAAALAFLGGTLFEVGSYLMVVEALDRGRETNFGTSLYRLLKNAESTVATDGREPSSSEDTDWPADKPGFVWWGKPMWDNMGYVAAIIMLFSASIFWISTLTGLPDVIPGLGEGHHRAVADVFFWSPQVIGGIGFVAASLILMLEVQHHWWAPRPLDIGWQASDGAIWASAFTSFLGSWAFLIASIAQVWEVIWREPPGS